MPTAALRASSTFTPAIHGLAFQDLLEILPILEEADREILLLDLWPGLSEWQALAFIQAAPGESLEALRRLAGLVECDCKVIKERCPHKRFKHALRGFLDKHQAWAQQESQRRDAWTGRPEEYVPSAPPAAAQCLPARRDVPPEYFDAYRLALRPQTRKSLQALRRHAVKRIDCECVTGHVRECPHVLAEPAISLSFQALDLLADRLHSSEAVLEPPAECSETTDIRSKAAAMARRVWNDESPWHPGDLVRRRRRGEQEMEDDLEIASRPIKLPNGNTEPGPLVAEKAPPRSQNEIWREELAAELARMRAIRAGWGKL